MMTLVRGLIAAGLQAISISLDIIADNIDPPDKDRELEELRGAVEYYQNRIVKGTGVHTPSGPGMEESGAHYRDSELSAEQLSKWFGR
jgi:hypothetical protein